MVKELIIDIESLKSHNKTIHEKEENFLKKIKIIIFLFFIALILFTSLIYGHYNSSMKHEDLLYSILNKNIHLVGDEWRFSYLNDDIIGNCDYIDNLDFENIIIGSGWNKKVVAIDSNRVLKKINLEGKTFSECFSNYPGNTIRQKNCIKNLAKSFINEIGNVMNYQNIDNVPRVYAYCIPRDYANSIDKLFIVEERGDKLDMIKLGQSTIKERLKIFENLFNFLLTISPLRINDFRRQQFIIVQDTPKLVDWDDVNIAGKEEWNKYTGCKFFDTFIKLHLIYENEDKIIGKENYSNILNKINLLSTICSQRDTNEAVINNILELLSITRMSL
uniref:Protein kinase domain-containing protein n=1 Tax=Strongyloides papillosus TaxID=174720 RepID=A0A0N5B6M0_STREA